jgi:hypothetical protein
LQLANLGLDQGGDYDVVVSNGSGSAVSAVAQVRVVPDRSPDELAHFTLADGPLDSLGKSGPADLDGVTFAGGALVLDGIYEYQTVSAPPEPYRGIFRIPGLDYHSFGVAVEFKPDLQANYTLLVGGTSYRWLALRNSGGRLALTLNNGASFHPFATADILPHQWNSVVCSVDLGSKRISTLLNGHPLEEVVLPDNFVLEVEGSFAVETDKLFTFTDYSYAGTFTGAAKELRVFARALTATELQHAGSEPGSPAIVVNGVRVTGETVVTTSPARVELLGDFDGSTILYTLDGSDPTHGVLYTGPFDLDDSASLSVVVYAPDFSRRAFSGQVLITVTGPPRILEQPRGLTVVDGTPVTFAVEAAGPGPIEQQWFRNGLPIAGATDRTLALGPAQALQSGDYTVVLGNGAGTITSSVARLEVLVRPVLVRRPVGRTVKPGADVTLCSDATGTEPLTYQWRRNGQNLPNATNNCLILPAVQPADGGAYSVVVANAAGTVTSEPAVVQVVLSPLQGADPMEARVLLPADNGTLTGSNTLATAQSLEPLHAGKPGGKSIWYRWRPGRTGIATIDTLLAVTPGVRRPPSASRPPTRIREATTQAG